eukprot:1347188-Amorphochlora_amoeboformis.AAC.1
MDLAKTNSIFPRASGVRVKTGLAFQIDREGEKGRGREEERRKKEDFVRGGGGRRDWQLGSAGGDRRVDMLTLAFFVV